MNVGCVVFLVNLTYKKDPRESTFIFEVHNALLHDKIVTEHI